MGFWNKKADGGGTAAVQLRDGGRHPFRLLDGYVPLRSGEIALYRSIREAVPILDAAIWKLIRLSGGVQVRCRTEQAQAGLERFLRTVDTGRGQRGVQSFLDRYLDAMLTCGRAVGEIVLDRRRREIAALLCGDPAEVEIREGASPMEFQLCTRAEGGGMEISMNKIINQYKLIMTYIGIIGLVGFIGSVLIQVTARTFLPTAPNWTEEAARFLFIYMVAFGGNAAVITDEYVGVEMLTEMFPKSVQKGIKTLVLVALTAFSAFVFLKCVMSSKGLIAITPPAMVSTALEIPMKYVYMSEVILFGFYMLSFLMRLYMLFTEKEEA